MPTAAKKAPVKARSHAAGSAERVELVGQARTAAGTANQENALVAKVLRGMRKLVKKETKQEVQADMNTTAVGGSTAAAVTVSVKEAPLTTLSVPAATSRQGHTRFLKDEKSPTGPLTHTSSHRGQGAARFLRDTKDAIGPLTHTASNAGQGAARFRRDAQDAIGPLTHTASHKGQGAARVAADAKAG